MYKGSKADKCSYSRRKRLPKKRFETERAAASGGKARWLESTDGKKHRGPLRYSNLFRRHVPAYRVNEQGDSLCNYCKRVLIIEDDRGDGDIFQEGIVECAVENCCYDCDFGWFCVDCCTTYFHNGLPFRTCSESFYASLMGAKSQRHGLTPEERAKYKKLFKIEFRKGSRGFRGKVINRPDPPPALGRIMATQADGLVCWLKRSSTLL